MVLVPLIIEIWHGHMEEKKTTVAFFQKRERAKKRKGVEKPKVTKIVMPRGRG